MQHTIRELWAVLGPRRVAGPGPAVVSYSEVLIAKPASEPADGVPEADTHPG